jgi:predicted PurR-regulated permease PerM
MCRATDKLDQGEVMPKKKNKLIIALVVIIVILLAVGGFFIYKYINTVNSDPTHQDQALVDNISRYIDLPNEQPTVATIVDRTKLSSQALSDQSQNGDKLLIFSEAKRIVLYRPSIGKIVAILTIQTQTELESGTK